MDATDLTIEILQGLRTDIQGLGKTLGDRIDQTNQRLDQTNQRLDRLAEGQVRMASQMNERLENVETEVRSLTERLDNVLIGPMGDSVRDHEVRLKQIERRLEM